MFILSVETKILNEVQTLIRLTARDMGIDYNTVMKKKRRPQSAMRPADSQAVEH